MANEEDDITIGHILTLILLFSFISNMILMITLIFIGSLNNYGLGQLQSIALSIVNTGIVPSDFAPIIVNITEGLLDLLPFIDILWFTSFIILIMASIIYSYFRNRPNYFNAFGMATFGLVIIVYVAGLIGQITIWFKDEIFFKIFPTASTSFPLFTWYLDNLGIANLIIICMILLANYINLDFAKYNKVKEGETLDEI